MDQEQEYSLHLTQLSTVTNNEKKIEASVRKKVGISAEQDLKEILSVSQLLKNENGVI